MTNPALRERLLHPALAHVVAIDFMMITSGAILTPAIALYVSSNGASAGLVGLVSSVFMFASIVARPLAGAVVDLAGERRIMILSIALTAVAGALLPMGLALSWIIGIRLLQGIGWACYSPASSTVMSELIPAGRRGEGFGYVSMVRNVGVAAGSVVGLYFVERGDFSLAFLAAVLATFGAWLVALRFRWAPQRLDGIREWSLNLLIEHRAVVPSIISAMMTFVMGAMMTFVPIDAQARNVGSASAFFLVFTLVLMVMRPLSGRLSDRLPSRGVLIAPGLAMAALSTLTLAFTENPWTLVAAALLWGIGFGTAQPVLRAMVLDRTPKQRWGAANATTTALYDLGLAMGPLMLGIVAGQGGLALMFGVASIMPIAAIALTLLTGLHKEPTRAEVSPSRAR